MKENSIKNERSSIEEDIKILEEMIENANIENMDMNNCFGGEHIEAIEHILSDYKRVLKENEEWDGKFCNLQNLYFKLQDESESKRKEYQETYKDVREELKEWQEAYKSEKKMKNEYVKLYQDLLLKENVIPVQKVKDKIEKLNDESHAEELEDIMNRKNYTITELVQYVLQELLEGRK